MKPSRIVAVLTAAVLMALPALTPAVGAPLVIPVPPREGMLLPDPPQVSAKAWIVYDAGAGIVLGSHEPDRPRAMASTTKMMTALLALKYGDPTSIVTISERAAGVGEAQVGVAAGERFPLALLVEALTIRSGNDAATAVAEHLSGSVESFVRLMNEEAVALGMSNTRFANPHGLDGPDHYSSPRDLLILALAVMEYPEYRAMVTTQELPFPDAPDGTARVIRATNRLIEEYPGALGIKTGFTNQALLVLAAAAEREGRTLFSVVMGSDGKGGHFEDSKTLLDWGFGRFGTMAMVTGPAVYEPDEPVRVVEAEPEPEPEPVVVETIRTSDGEPPGLAAAFGWAGRFFESYRGG
ncbi:hypothetical protein BH23ACT5_BH23ACT5_00410 [soil metagenome]